MLEVFYTNCGGRFESTKLHGLGELHIVEEGGVPLLSNNAEIVDFVNSNFDSDRGDKLRVEGVDRGEMRRTRSRAVFVGLEIV